MTQSVRGLRSDGIANRLSAYLCDLRVQCAVTDRLLCQALATIGLTPEQRAMNFACRPPEILRIIAGHVRRLISELVIEPDRIRLATGIIPECKDFYCLQQNDRQVSRVDVDSLDAAFLWFPFDDKERSTLIYQDIWRVLKPGGKIVVVQTDAYAPHAKAHMTCSEASFRLSMNCAPRIASYHRDDKGTGEALRKAGFHDVSKVALQITKREVCETLFLNTVDDLILDRPNDPRLAWALETIAIAAFYAKDGCASDSDRLVLIEAIKPQVDSCPEASH